MTWSPRCESRIFLAGRGFYEAAEFYAVGYVVRYSAEGIWAVYLRVAAVHGLLREREHYLLRLRVVGFVGYRHVDSRVRPVLSVVDDVLYSAVRYHDEVAFEAAQPREAQREELHRSFVAADAHPVVDVVLVLDDYEHAVDYVFYEALGRERYA